MSHGRVFVIESPNPLDLLESRGERDALLQVCKLAGHDTSAFVVRDAEEFRLTCNYVSSIRGSNTDKTPLFLHISLHGNAKEIGIGRDSMDWKELAAIVQEMYGRLRYYHGPVIIVLSACGANKQQLTNKLRSAVTAAEKPFVPPEYVFVFGQDTVAWVDAVVTWTIFYRAVKRIDFFKEKEKVQDLLKRLRTSGFGDLKYFRWDNPSKKYRFYPKS